MKEKYASSYYILVSFKYINIHISIKIKSVHSICMVNMLLDLLSLLLLRHSDLFGDLDPLFPGLESSAHACIPFSESRLFPHMTLDILSCRRQGLLHVCSKEIITYYQESLCIGPDEAFLFLNSLP